jgi:peptidoglycan-N-acetylglucosamine deacetylase
MKNTVWRVAMGLFVWGAAHATESSPAPERDGGPPGYVWCAREGDSVDLDGTQDVAFGANGNFAYAFNQAGAVTFSSAAFGRDPAPGVVKAGYRRRSEPPADPLGILRKPIPDKLVVLTFDDGCVTHATYVAPLLKSMGFGGSFYVCTLPNFETRKDWYMTWEQMKAMVQDGFEIGNHTRHHTVGAGIDAFLDMEREMMKHGLPKPVTQAWPCYAPSTKTFADLTSNQYSFARGGHFRAYRPTVDHPLDIPSVNPKDTKTFIRDVQQAANGAVVVITYHGVPDYEHDFAGTDPKIFKEMMQYLKDNGYKVIALRDLAEYIDPVQAAKLPPTKQP